MTDAMRCQSLPRPRPRLYAVLNNLMSFLSGKKDAEVFLQILFSIAKYLLTTFVMAWAQQVIRKLIECEV